MGWTTFIVIYQEAQNCYQPVEEPAEQPGVHPALVTMKRSPPDGDTALIMLQ